MIHEDDDHLSNSIFDSSLRTSFMDGRSIHASQFSLSHHIEVNDPWGNPGAFYSSHTDLGRSFTAPNFQGLCSTTKTTDHFTDTAAVIFSGVALPESYNILFTETQRHGRVSLLALHKILERAHLSSLDVEKIIQLVVPIGTSYVTRLEFTATLALIYCAQNRLDLSFDSLYRQREVLGFPALTPTELVRPTNHFASPPPTTTTNGNIIEPFSKMDFHHSSSPSSESTISSTSTSTATIHQISPARNLDTKHWFKDMEEIKLTIAPEREGFIFKYVNYIVTSQQRSSMVLRRFSDFWWLLEILSRRYPFRMLPVLPPKKLGGREGTTFLEKRRKGLSRFMNSVVRHPILRNDPLVSKFLTEPSELVTWRKQSPPSLDNEYNHKQHDIEGLKSAIPDDIVERIQKTRTSVGSSIDHYVNMCYIMERTIRRMNDQATDYARISVSLSSLAHSEQRYHASECENCQWIVNGYENVAKHMQRESSILDNQVSISGDGVLENLKQVRDLLVSFRELVDRKEKLGEDNSEILKKRISSTKSKLAQHKGVPSMESEVKRLIESQQLDEQELQELKCRHIFMQHCIWTEMTYLHKQQAFVSTLYRNYVKEMAKFSKLLAENWRQLEGPVFEMPVDWDAFG